MNYHIQPSWYVRKTCDYLVWCKVSECTACHSLAKYEDMHPANPCPFCGERVAEAVGRWAVTRPRKFFGLISECGFWQLLRDFKEATA